MTNHKIKLEIVSAEEELFSDEVEMVFAPAEMGEVGITSKHTPLITKLKPGDFPWSLKGQNCSLSKAYFF